MTRADALASLAREGLPLVAPAIFMDAVERIAASSSGRVTVFRMAEETGYDAESIKIGLMALLDADVFFAKFEPSHAICGDSIGPAETSEAEVRRKAHEEEYGRTCPRCGRYLDEHVVVRIQFWLSRGYTS